MRPWVGLWTLRSSILARGGEMYKHFSIWKRRDVVFKDGGGKEVLMRKKRL